MKNKKKNEEYLSYIEETKKHRKKLKDIVARATRSAGKKAISNNNFITYLDGTRIVREYPDGRKVVIKKITEDMQTKVDKVE